MPKRAKVIGAVLALTLSLGAAGAGVLGTPMLVRRLDVAQPSWHPGTAPSPPQPVLAASAKQPPVPTAAGLAAALGPLVSAPGLGTRTTVSVVDVATGNRLFGQEPDALTVPASTTKLVTGVAALAARGPTYRIPTRAVAGATPGEVVLVGGGDPTLASGPAGAYPGAARLDELAKAVREALGGTAPTRVIYDGSLFGGDVFGPGWDPDVPTGGFGGPITALMTDGGRVNPRVRAPSPRYPQPDLAAAQSFARSLGLPATAASPGVAAPGAGELAKVESPPMVRLVEIMMTDSDNILAEALARQVALAKDQPGTFAGGVAAMRTVLDGLGLPVAGYALADGSGLSRLNRVSPALLTAILAVSARPDRPDLHAMFTGLPVAAYSGTLAGRYRNPQSGGSAAGLVRAKTGTLTGVSSIAGVVVTADGATLAFAVLAENTNRGTGPAQEALDRIAATLAACGCRG